MFRSSNNDKMIRKSIANNYPDQLSSIWWPDKVHTLQEQRQITSHIFIFPCSIRAWLRVKSHSLGERFARDRVVTRQTVAAYCPRSLFVLVSPLTYIPNSLITCLPLPASTPSCFPFVNGYWLILHYLFILKCLFPEDMADGLFRQSLNKHDRFRSSACFILCSREFF